MAFARPWQAVLLLDLALHAAGHGTSATTVDGQVGCGDLASLVGGQEQVTVGDVDGVNGLLRGLRGDKTGCHLLRDVGHGLGPYQTRGDGIAADAEGAAFCGELVDKCPERLSTAICCRGISGG